MKKYLLITRDSGQLGIFERVKDGLDLICGNIIGVRSEAYFSTLSQYTIIESDSFEELYDKACLGHCNHENKINIQQRKIPTRVGKDCKVL